MTSQIRASCRGFCVGFFLIFFTSLAQADEVVSLKVGYLLLSPAGDIAVEENGFGTRIDLDDDLDIDDSEDFMAEAALAFGDVKLTVGYLPLSFEGSSILSRPIVVNGNSYDFATPVASSLELDIFDVGLTWYIFNFDDLPTRFQLGVELAVKVTDATASITNSTTGVSESAAETLPIPTLGLRGRIAFSDLIGINGRFGYLGYNDNYFMDVDVQVEFSPLPLVGVFAGYRYLDIAIDESDLYVDTQLAGLYGGAFVRF